MLKDPSTADPDSFLGKSSEDIFVHRKEISMTSCDVGNIFHLNHKNILISLEIRLMIALRFLVRGKVADMISELFDDKVQQVTGHDCRLPSFNLV
jgi:hypothetical protein